MAAFIIRLTCYSLLQSWASPWLVLPIELLHGVTFGLAWSAGNKHAQDLAPPGMGSSMIGVFQAMYFGLGNGAGRLLSGWVYHAQGPRAVFALAALWEGVGWAVCGLA